MNNDIIDKFSTHLKHALTRAMCLAVETNDSIVEPGHLLWALGTQKGSIAAEVLKKAQIKKTHLRKLVGQDPKAEPLTSTSFSEATAPNLSESARRGIEKAVLTATIYKHTYIGTEHLLSGLLQIRDRHVEKLLNKKVIDRDELNQQLSTVLKSTSKFPEMAETISSEETERSENSGETEEGGKTPALDYFGNDLTDKNTHENIDPVIGREEEIQRMMEILSRRTKNNPLLIGEPGVGKTAVVEGLAKRIAEGNVPPTLQNKRLISIDLTLIIAGTMYRGEFEGRLRQIVDEAKRNPHIILFIDEIHTIIGAGAASGSLDAANILKPALARGDIRCIGATTLSEYKKHLETDSALERRFQTIHVEEPSIEKATHIVQGVAPYYESFHGVRIAPTAIEQAVKLSARYLPHKQLPDKAIDLIDEAAASLRVRSTTRGPKEERQLLARQIQEVQEKKRQAVVEEQYLEAIALKEEEESLRDKLRELALNTQEPTEVVSKELIADILSRSTNIPAETLLKQGQGGERFEQQLGERIRGQLDVVKTVAEALRRAKAGIAHPHRPLTSFLFLGPSGVGKTELAKAVAELLFQDSKALIRLDMSEYAEGFTSSKLVGAPAGYVGYRETSTLTDRIKQRPYSVILFDELEKAHGDVQNLLLQILEEGELKDATGRTINFRNAVIIMTSNIGLEKLEGSSLGFANTQEQAAKHLRQDVLQELQQRFRPELVNRIDHTCVFQNLSSEILHEIADKHLQELATRIQEEHGITITIGEDIAKHVVAEANTKFGARDIRRSAQTHIETPIAERLLKNDQPSRLFVRKKGKQIVVTQPRGTKTKT